jgi:hypothetical protein
MASFVLTKDKVFWSKKSDSHEDIIREFDLHPDGAHGPNILRVEIAPPDNNYALPVDQWVYRTDQDTLPKWANAKDDEARSRIALVDWHKHGVILAGQIIEKLADGEIIKRIAGGTVKRIAGGTVKRIDRGTVEGIYGGTVECIDGGTVERIDGGTVEYIYGGTVERIAGGTVKRIYGNAIVCYYSGKPTAELLFSKNAVIIDRTGNVQKIITIKKDRPCST